MLTAIGDSVERPITMPGRCSRCEPERGRVPDAYLVAAILSRRELGKRLAK